MKLKILREDSSVLKVRVKELTESGFLAKICKRFWSSYRVGLRWNSKIL